MLSLISENDFVRRFILDGQIFVDSKYRTCELPFRADFFIAQWKTADRSLRADMELSLAEFPSSIGIEAAKIREFLCTEGPSYSARACIAAMARQRDFPDVAHVRLYVAIAKAVIERGASAWTFVGENRWFRVLQSISELRVEEKPCFHSDPPSDAELARLIGELPEGLYRWGVEMVYRGQGERIFRR